MNQRGATWQGPSASNPLAAVVNFTNPVGAFSSMAATDLSVMARMQQAVQTAAAARQVRGQVLPGLGAAMNTLAAVPALSLAQQRAFALAGRGGRPSYATATAAAVASVAAAAAGTVTAPSVGVGAGAGAAASTAGAGGGTAGGEAEETGADAGAAGRAAAKRQRTRPPTNPQLYKKRSWTREQDQALLVAMSDIIPHRWKLIAERVPGRDHIQPHVRPCPPADGCSGRARWMPLLVAADAAASGDAGGLVVCAHRLRGTPEGPDIPGSPVSLPLTVQAGAPLLLGAGVAWAPDAVRALLRAVAGDGCEGAAASAPASALAALLTTHCLGGPRGGPSPAPGAQVQAQSGSVAGHGEWAFGFAQALCRAPAPEGAAPQALWQLLLSGRLDERAITDDTLRATYRILQLQKQCLRDAEPSAPLLKAFRQQEEQRQQRYSQRGGGATDLASEGWGQTFSPYQWEQAAAWGAVLAWQEAS
eukprot:g2255.t1